MPEATWCHYDAQCCSGNCAGGRCLATVQPATADRCVGGPYCSGRDLCDPVNGICLNRWCLPANFNAYSGCCRWSTGSDSCHFTDGGSCILPGNQAGASAASCCSGTTYTTGTPARTYCDSVQLF
jgi:hypothetical protein